MFTIRHSGIFVGTGVLDGPEYIMNLSCKHVEFYTYVDIISFGFFILLGPSGTPVPTIA